MILVLQSRRTCACTQLLLLVHALAGRTSIEQLDVLLCHMCSVGYSRASESCSLTIADTAITLDAHVVPTMPEANSAS